MFIRSRLAVQQISVSARILIKRADAVGESSSAKATKIPTTEGMPVQKKFHNHSEFEGIVIKNIRILHCFIPLHLSADTRSGATRM